MGRKKKKQLKPWCWYPFQNHYFVELLWTIVTENVFILVARHHQICVFKRSWGL